MKKKTEKYQYLLIDNYDSFSYNLVELFRGFEDIHLTVLKHDDPAILFPIYDAIIISPGPGLPETSGLLMQALKQHIGQTPVLGICLGLQAIALHYGGKLRQLDEVFHGIREQIQHTGDNVLFQSIERDFIVGRYHSWVADVNPKHSKLRRTAFDDDSNIMALEVPEDMVYAVQFHPESYMTPTGKTMVENFHNLVQAFYLKENK